MTDALIPEVLIALFAGLVAVAIMRKNTPRPVELLLWAGLVWVCVLGVTSVHDKPARDLTLATWWGLLQLVGSLIGGLQQGVLQWVIDNRFFIADWAVLLAGADLLLLAYLRSRREAAGWQPQVRLRDWMELPRYSEPKPAPVTVSAVEEINRKFNLWAPVAAAAAVTWTTFFLIWTGDVAAPSIGRRIRMAAVMANGARRQVASRRLTAQVIEMADLPRRAAGVRSRATTWLAQAGEHPEVNWLGGFATMPPDVEDGGTDNNGTQLDRRDQLAS